jgi:hypothetical protein
MVTTPDSNSDLLTLRLRSFVASVIDVYQDANVSEPQADGFVPDEQFMSTVASLMQDNELKFITYIVEKQDG